MFDRESMAKVFSYAGESEILLCAGGVPEFKHTDSKYICSIANYIDFTR